MQPKFLNLFLFLLLASITLSSFAFGQYGGGSAPAAASAVAMATVAVATDSDLPTTEPDPPPASGPEPSYPGIGPTKAKLEGTLGPLKVRFYGTLLLNISASDSAEVGEEVPLWAVPGSVLVTFPDGGSRRAGEIHDTIFTARQSILGFTLSPASTSEDHWNPSALLEFDFFGSRPVDTVQPQARVFNQPRLRLGYFQLEKGAWKILAGQDHAIVAPLDPVSLSHVSVPLGATAGNLWGWMPQVRVEHTHHFGNTSALLQLGVLRPQFADPRFSAAGVPGGSDLPTPGTAIDSSPGLGERASHPFYQARVAVSHPRGDSTATIGAAAHYGRERIGARRTLDSWAFALDWSVPFYWRLMFRGESFVGSNLVPFQGGILQGVAILQPVATAPPRQINRIGAGGGWAELIVPATADNKNIFYFGVGTDDPRDRQLLQGTGRSKNSMGWASYFRKLTSEVTLAFEWSDWQFRTRNFVGGLPAGRGATGRGNVFNLALAYQF